MGLRTHSYDACKQCTTTVRVDDTVKGYWVERVWYMHAHVNAEKRWTAFERSPFFQHVPCCTFPGFEPSWARCIKLNSCKT